MRSRLMNFIGKKIARKLAITIALIILIIQTLFSYYELISNQAKLEQSLSDNRTSLTDIAANAFSNAVWNYNDDGIQTIANSFMKNNIIASIEIQDNSKGIIFTQRKTASEFDTDYLQSNSEAISFNRVPIGEISIEFTRYYLEESLKSDTLLKLTEILITTLMMVIAISIVSFRITDPLKTLSEGTDEISSGNLDKQIAIASNDEFGDLATKFNVMTKNLNTMMAEREKAMSALSASEEKFSKAFQSSADIIGIVRLSDKHFLDISNSFFESFGYSRDEVINHNSEDFGLWLNSVDRAAFYDQIDKNSYNQKLESKWRTKQGDEQIGILAVNSIEISGEPCLLFVWHDITQRKQAEEKLQTAHNLLETKVEERTKELIELNKNLSHTNEELSTTLEMLQKTQFQLIQSEKMAGLGTLVAGVAHEINTPIGISITAISYLEDLRIQFSNLYQTGAIKRQDLESYLSRSQETIGMIVNNLDRASKLIHSFKQVAVDQSTEAKRIFRVKEYLEELLLSLHPKIKKTNQSIEIDCPDNLVIESYPGAFAQIITNLVMNSLIHAYDPLDEGKISIQLTESDHNLVVRYSDDGRGMTTDVKEKMFDPFYTTKRLEGGTGLGMHVIYNIVTLQLMGTITCDSEPNTGTQFLIKFPL